MDLLTFHLMKPGARLHLQNLLQCSSFPAMKSKEKGKLSSYFIFSIFFLYKIKSLAWQQPGQYCPAVISLLFFLSFLLLQTSLLQAVCKWSWMISTGACFISVIVNSWIVLFDVRRACMIMNAADVCTVCNKDSTEFPPWMILFPSKSYKNERKSLFLFSASLLISLFNLFFPASAIELTLLFLI